MNAADLGGFPGGALVEKGLRDAAQGLESEEALLVQVAATRLRGLGFDVERDSRRSGSSEHALYEAIELRCGAGAHGAYNALIGRIVSFANAFEQAHGASARRNAGPK